MQQGIDVSRYQGEIDWEQVKASGVQFAMLRAVSTSQAQGGVYIDPTFEHNYAECKRVGIPVGAYYYTYAKTRSQAQRELQVLQTALADKQFEYPIVVDVEDERLKELSPGQLTDLVVYALKMLESWKYYAMLYTYTYFYETQLDAAPLAAFDLWIADYAAQRPSIPNGMWQYSNVGQVPGIQVDTDLDRAYKDYPAIMEKAGLNGFGVPPVQPTLYKLQLGWITGGDFEAAQNALAPVIRDRQLEAYYSVQEK